MGHCLSVDGERSSQTVTNQEDVLQPLLQSESSIEEKLIVTIGLGGTYCL